MRHTRAGPLRDGIFAGLAVLIATLLASGAVLLRGESQFRDEVHDDLVRLAKVAASTIDGDLHASIVEPEQEGSPGYERAIAPLARIRAAAGGVRYVYTVVERDGAVRFVLDPTPAGDADEDGVDDKSHVMDAYDDASPEMLAALREGRPTVEAEPSHDAWGTFLTGYAPFFSSSGALAGVVGLDVSAEDYLARVNRLRGAAALGIALGALVAGGVGWIVYLLQRSRQRADRALGDSEERFALLANQAPVMLWVTDAGGRCTFANPAWLAFTGLTAEQALGRVAPPGLAEEDETRWQQSFANACATGGEWSCEVRQRRADGAERWLLAEAKPRRQPDGVLAGHVGFAVDLTERKRVETALAAARDAAEESSRAKSEFVAKVSHELRTPMNGVLGLAELLLRTPLTDEQREFVRLITTSGEMLLGLVNDVLDFARLEARKLVLANEPFDVHELVDGCGRLVRVSAEQKGVALRIEVGPGVPRPVRGDRDRLRQVLVNLLGNAVKFTERGEICLRVEAGPPEAGGVRLRFVVADTGIGISAADLSRLFLAFSQVDSSSSRRHAGAGLGLVIARQLVERMGGEIAVESTPGSGSTFSFSVVLGAATAAELAASAATSDAAAEARTPGASPGAGRRVLLAEDNLINQKVATRLLADAGFEVEVAADGRRAVEAFRAGRFDLVLMDCQMPEMDGYEATGVIRTLPGGDVVPIVALTANAMPGDRDRCLAAGMDDYVSKPVRPEALREVLARVRRRGPAGAAPEDGPALAQTDAA